MLIGNEEDFNVSLGFKIEGVDDKVLGLEVDNLTAMIETATAPFPTSRSSAPRWAACNLRASTTGVHSRGQPLHGLCKPTTVNVSRSWTGLGWGDSFASGLIIGLLDGQPLGTAVEYGAAHGALAMTTPGDTTMVTKAEVLKLAGGGAARVDR